MRPKLSVEGLLRDGAGSAALAFVIDNGVQQNQGEPAKLEARRVCEESSGAPHVVAARHEHHEGFRPRRHGQAGIDGTRGQGFADPELERVFVHRVYREIIAIAAVQIQYSTGYCVRYGTVLSG